MCNNPQCIFVELNVVINVLEICRKVIYVYACLIIQNALFIESNILINILKMFMKNNLFKM